VGRSTGSAAAAFDRARPFARQVSASFARSARREDERCSAPPSATPIHARPPSTPKTTPSGRAADRDREGHGRRWDRPSAPTIQGHDRWRDNASGGGIDEQQKTIVLAGPLLGRLCRLEATLHDAGTAPVPEPVARWQTVHLLLPSNSLGRASRSGPDGGLALPASTGPLRTRQPPVHRGEWVMVDAGSRPASATSRGHRRGCMREPATGPAGTDLGRRGIRRASST
jgi:hypothetical protein